MLAHCIKTINKNRFSKLHERHNVVLAQLEVIYAKKYEVSSYFSSTSYSTKELSSTGDNSSYQVSNFRSLSSKDLNQLNANALRTSFPSQSLFGDNVSNHQLYKRSFPTLDSREFVATPSFEQTLENIRTTAHQYSLQRRYQGGSSLNYHSGNHSILGTLNSFDENDERDRIPSRQFANIQYRTFSTKPTRPEDASEQKKPDQSSGFSTSTKSSKSSSSPQTSPMSSIESNLSKIADPTTSEKIQTVIESATKAITKFIMATPGVLWFYLTHPAEFKQKMIDFKEAAKKEAHHYYMGTKLLAADVRTARKIFSRTLSGSSLTRRERKQLLRTTADLFRLVPMSMFVLIPFMEFALPFALKIFPNMLPSTFQDSLKAEESMKRELQSRIAMAGFFQETLQSLAKEQKKRASKSNESKGDEEEIVTEEEETAKDFLNFLEKSRNGEVIPPEVIIKYAKYFEDELTLDNMSRMQLINMCRYMGIPPYGADSLLRFQLRHRIRTLREDDQRIIWEGIDALTKMELREACQERGMRSIGLSKSAYKLALQQWLDLSVVKHVPISLLIMSRTFFLREEAEKMTSGASFADDSKAALSIADAISGLEKEVVNEVVLDVAAKSTKDHKDPEVVKIKLEVLQQQNELIKEEYEEREAKKKKKEEEEAAHVAAELAEQENETDDKQIVVDTDTIQIEAEVEKEPIESSISEKVDIVIKEEVVASELTEVVETEGEKESEEEDEEDEKELSAEEIEAISQLLSPNAVLSEREELERIKAAMAKNEEDGILDEETEGNNESIETDQESVSSVSEPEPVVLPSGTIEYESSDELDKKS